MDTRELIDLTSNEATKGFLIDWQLLRHEDDYDNHACFNVACVMFVAGYLARRNEELLAKKADVSGAAADSL